MARRTPRPGPGQEQLDFGDDWQAQAERATRSRHGGTKPTPETGFSRVRTRNLRATGERPIKEELPDFLSFDSSRVAEAGYSSASGTLYVRFVDGTPWEYRNVEPNVWRNFRRSASPGRYINRILNNYDYGRSRF